MLKKRLGSDARLFNWASNYEEQYFKDMGFKHNELREKYLKHKILHKGEWVTEYDDGLGDVWSLIYEFSFSYEEMYDGTGGICEYETKQIKVNSKTMITERDIKQILLHEMIHGYEYWLPPGHQHLLVIYLYDKLTKRLGKKKLDKIIRMDQNSITMKHTPLFLLKSLTIDLARRLDLGTIYGYDRPRLFK